MLFGRGGDALSRSNRRESLGTGRLQSHAVKEVPSVAALSWDVMSLVVADGVCHGTVICNNTSGLTPVLSVFVVVVVVVGSFLYFNVPTACLRSSLNCCADFYWVILNQRWS
jgi:hypothetical protein